MIQAIIAYFVDGPKGLQILGSTCIVIGKVFVISFKVPTYSRGNAGRAGR